MDFSKLIPGFIKYATWIKVVKVFLCIPRPLSKKTKLKFDQDFKAC